MKKHKLYIDEEGVERGYYVYLHKSAETGKVFYVGKGLGKRAWDSKKRNSDWKSKVEELDNNWEVEIYKEDLTENEAYRLEEKLVKEFGFFDDENDQLTNRFPGGDMPATFTIGTDNEENDWEEAYKKFRKFNSLSKVEKKELAKNLYEELNIIYEQLWELDNEADYSKDILGEDGLYFPGDVISTFEDAMIASKYFLNKQISWKEFCLEVEHSFDFFHEEWIGSDEANKQNLSTDTFEKFLESRKVVNTAYRKIDSKKKQETIKLANQAATNIPLEISSKIPNQANVIQISSEKSPEELFEYLCQVVISKGFRIRSKDRQKLIFKTEFDKFEEAVKLQIIVEIEDRDKCSMAFLRGRIKDTNLNKWFSKEKEIDLIFDSIWCKTKFPRVSFGKLAMLANQEINHSEINYLCQN